MARTKTVLVVEDDDDLRRLYARTLTLAGYRVKEARGGFEALRLIDSEHPDAIVLDLMMPGVDGFAVLNELTGQAHTRQIPIVVVTGVSGDLQWIEAKCLLKKPATPERVVQAVRECLASGTAL